MINSKLTKKSLKSRSLKLKNKRTKKSKVSRKNVKKNIKNMKGGLITNKKEAYDHLERIFVFSDKGDDYGILNILNDEQDVLLTQENLTLALIINKFHKLQELYNPAYYDKTSDFYHVIDRCFSIIQTAYLNTTKTLKIIETLRKISDNLIQIIIKEIDKIKFTYNYSKLTDSQFTAKMTDNMNTFLDNILRIPNKMQEYGLKPIEEYMFDLDVKPDNVSYIYKITKEKIKDYIKNGPLLHERSFHKSSKDPLNRIRSQPSLGRSEWYNNETGFNSSMPFRV